VHHDTSFFLRLQLFLKLLHPPLTNIQPAKLWNVDNFSRGKLGVSWQLIASDDDNHKKSSFPNLVDLDEISLVRDEALSPVSLLLASNSCLTLSFCFLA
jgi:hypothetical protein